VQYNVQWNACKFSTTRNVGRPKGRPTWWPTPPSRWWFRRVSETPVLFLSVSGLKFMEFWDNVGTQAVSQLSLSSSTPEIIGLKVAIKLRRFAVYEPPIICRWRTQQVQRQFVTMVYCQLCDKVWLNSVWSPDMKKTAEFSEGGR